MTIFTEIASLIAQTVIPMLLSAGLAFYVSEKNRRRGLDRGVQALLRCRMLIEYERYKKEGITYSEKKNFINMYECYHALGKNGVMTSIYQLVLDMEIKKEYEK